MKITGEKKLLEKTQVGKQACFQRFVLLNKSDYVAKMEATLNDESKFAKNGEE